MAGKTKTKGPRPPVGRIVAPPQPVNYGRTVSVEVKKSADVWNDFHLADGTILHIKPMIAEVQRAVGKFNQEGEPIYLVKIGTILKTTVPKRLKIRARRS